MSPRPRWIAILLAIAACHSVAKPANAQSAKERELKAKYIQYFLYYIRWPKRHLPTRVAILGPANAQTKDVWHRYLANTVNGRKIDDLEVSCTYYSGQLPKNKDFDLVFVVRAGSPVEETADRLKKELTKRKRPKTLFVVEGKQNEHAMVSMWVDKNRLQVGLNRTTLSSGGFRIHRKLRDLRYVRYYEGQKRGANP